MLEADICTEFVRTFYTHTGIRRKTHLVRIMPAARKIFTSNHYMSKVKMMIDVLLVLG